MLKARYHYTDDEIDNMPIRRYLMGFEQGINQMIGESGGEFNFMSGVGVNEKHDREYKEFKEHSHG